ncbi:MAG: right-handed parallel beta-helix repeat-containing protein [Acidobacteriota bacterium]
MPSIPNSRVGGRSRSPLLSRTALALACAALPLLAALPAAGQACYQSVVLGGNSTVSYSAGFAVTGSPLSNLNALDGNYYQATSLVETTSTPSFKPMVESWIETGYDTSGRLPQVGPDYYGGVFVNPTNSAITVSQVAIDGSTTNPASRPAFGAIVATVAPSTGSWSAVSTTLLQWTGSLVVPPHGAQEFIVLARPNRGNYTSQTDVTLKFTVTTTTGGPYTASIHQIQVNITTWAASTVVGFDLTGSSTFTPRAFVSGAVAGVAQTFSIRVAQTDDSNEHNEDSAASGLQVTVTIPAGWSNVSVPTLTKSWWNNPTIVQPTATSSGSVSATTKRVLSTGSSTPANSFVIQATPPSATDTTNLTGLYTFAMTLNGGAQGDNSPIQGTTQGIVQVSNAVDVRFLSPAFTLSSPLRQLALRTDFNVLSGAETEAVAVQVYNVATASWQLLSTVTPGATNTTVTYSFGANFSSYLNSSNQMLVRYLVTAPSPWQRVRIDDLLWTVVLGFTVDNSVGSDSNSGDVAHPLATIGAALSRLTSPSQAVYVQVGNSQSGTPYTANLVVSGASAGGTQTCPTLIQGVANGSGQLPLIQGANPASDVGFDVGGGGANYVTVDGFQIQNTQVALYAEQGATGITFSHCLVSVPASGYGILFYANSGATAKNNKIDGNNNSTFYGIYDYAGVGTLLDGNVVRRMKNAEALFCTGSSGLVLRRNICLQSYMGIHLAQPAGTVTVSNNDCDSNAYLGIYAEQVGGTVVSTDNILTSNGVGWGWDGSGSIVSDYDDVWNNKSNYAFHGTVAAGSHSISANPLFVQVTDWTQPTFYQLGSGSPCIGTGNNVCCGTSMGAVQ